MPTRLFQTTIDIDAPAAAVWPVMSDVERWHEWTASITSVTRTSTGPLGVGSRARVRQPRLAPADFVVTTWQPDRGFEWVTRNPAVTAVGRHTIDAIGERSRVTLGVEFSGPLAAVIAWFYGGLTERYIRMEAEGLKRTVESRPD